MRFVYLLQVVVLLHTPSLVLSEKMYSSITPHRLQSSGTQCSDQDRRLWQSSASNSRQFYNNIETCASFAAGSTDITTDAANCLTQIHSDLSTSCAECFAADLDCGATNCRVPCQADSNSAQCQICLEPCTSALASCAGTTNLPQSDTGSASGSVGVGVVLVTVASLGLSLMNML
jgi:hypothetical protein